MYDSISATLLITASSRSSSSSARCSRASGEVVANR
jgi:hypothetical protein